MICSSFHTFLYVIKLVKTRPLCSSSDFLSHFFMRKVNPPIGWRRGPTAAGVLVVSLYRVNRFRWREIRLMVFHPKTSWIPLLMKDLNDKASLHSISIVTGSQTTYPWWDFGATSELELCSRGFFYWFGFVSTQVRQLSQIIHIVFRTEIIIENIENHYVSNLLSN